MTPLVSILTPSLNQRRFIENALASVKGQTYLNVEHLIIDGGSTDGTLDILRAHEGGSVRWLSERDAGMYDALNKGLGAASGDVIGYLNCDDVYAPWAIETVVRALEANPDADVVFGDGLTIDETTGRQRLTLIPPFDVRALALSGSLVQPAVFWRRRALQQHGGFDAELRFVGDLDYWLRLGRDAAFVRIDEVLAVERHHDAALSRAFDDRMAAETIEVRGRHARSLGADRRIRLVIARARHAIWRRFLWLRFLRQLRGPMPARGSGWSEFIAYGELRVSPRRVTGMFIPRVGKSFAWDAVRSNRAWFTSAGSPDDPQ